MPSFTTLAKIVLKKVYEEIAGKPSVDRNQRQCKVCKRSVRPESLLEGICPLCRLAQYKSGTNTHEETDVQCSGCGEYFHQDALKNGICVNCWTKESRAEDNHGSSAMTLNQAYEILELPKTASKDEITRKYRELAKQFHPDRIQGKDLHPDFIEFAKNRFQLIQTAYELIVKSKK